MSNLVTIVIPVYNAEAYILSCIGSLLKQTHTEIEIILVEDCSSDNSLAICRELALSYDCIKLIEHEVNTGYCVARNDGMEAAKGRWLMFLDADDEHLSNTIEIMVGAINNLKSDFVFAGYYNVRLDMSKNSVTSGIPSKAYSRQLFSQMLLTDMEWSILSYPCSKIYDKSFLDRGLIRFSEYHDGTFLLDCLSKSDNIGYLDKAVCLYFQREGSISRRYRPNMFDFINEVDERLHHFLLLNNALSDQRLKLLVEKRAGLIIGSLYNVVEFRGWIEFRDIYKSIRNVLIDRNIFSFVMQTSDIRKKTIIILLKSDQITLSFLVLKLYLLIKTKILSD
jgi:glycosyltransferase involved in cell wall biosynthesis